MNQRSRLLLFFLFSLVISCQNDKIEPEETEIVRAELEDFEEAKQVSPTLAVGLELSLWAPGPLLSNAVALTFDNNGVAYVAETSRRKSSDIDIRSHRDWMVDELALQSLEDTRAFHLEKLATEFSDQNTWLEDFNGDSIRDYRDLEVQSEYIRRIWDSDGDGRADASQLYAEGFNDMLTGVAAGILHYDDHIFLTAAPDVWKLKDTDKDGIADEREKISHGYGIHIAYAGHDMSGLTLGPDGKIYWSIGDIGVNAVGPDGKRWAYPNQGAVMRANPDGTAFEVFAHGLRNPQELAFDAYGNLISVDNDGDHPGEHERYVHIVEGSDSGWRINWQFGKYGRPNESYKVWMDEQLSVPHFPGQAAYITPPLALAYDGPAGLAFNPGTALEEKWRDHFFASFFTASSARSKIQAFKIKSKGASFEIVEEKDVVGGIVPTGITFAADGALYINDWKDSYAKKPAGRIWKLDVPEDQKSPVRLATQKILQEGVADYAVSELNTLLGHSDQRVRLAAQFELVKRKELAILVAATKDGPNLFARLHAIWGVGQLARQSRESAAPLLELLGDEEAEIRAQTAKVLGEARFQPALIPLIGRLKDNAKRVRFFAAEALGKLGDPTAFQPLVELLETVEDSETHLRHGVVYAISRLDQASALADLSDHPSRQVRIGAVVALRTMRSPLVAKFLEDQDPLVLTEAARAINDDLSIPEALPALAQALVKLANIQNEAFIRRAINANLRLGDAASAKRLVEYAQLPGVPDEMREDALWALGYWSEPPVLDRVDGRYRPLEGHKVSDAQQAIDDAFVALLENGKTPLQAAVITAAGRLNYQEGADKIYTLFRDRSAKLEIKQAALTALAQLGSPDLAAALDLALLDKRISLRTTAQDLLSSVELPAAELVAKYEKILNNSTVAERQKALASLSGIDAPEAEELLRTWWGKFTDEALEPALQLDLLMAIENSSFESLKNLKRTYEESMSTDDMLEQYKVTMYGGDERAGRRIFARNESAQCIRCHVVGEYGGEVGPELTHIASKLDRNDLLLSLVAPNARIAPGYGTVILKLKDGKEVVGVLEEETTDAVKVKTGNDPVKTFAKNDIQEKETLPSGMFNMSSVLDKNQIRDVMAFLMTLK